MPVNSSVIDPSVAPGASVKKLLPCLVAVAFFMESLDTTILNTAVPTIAKALDVAPLNMKAVLSSYTLSLAMFIPISGWNGRSLRHSPGVLVRHWPLHLGVFSLWHFEQHSRPGRVPHSARMRRSHDGARGPAHHGSNVCQVGTHPRHGLLGHSRSNRPHARPYRRRSHRWVLSSASDFFINLPIGLLGLYMVYRHLPDYREEN